MHYFKKITLAHVISAWKRLIILIVVLFRQLLEKSGCGVHYSTCVKQNKNVYLIISISSLKTNQVLLMETKKTIIPSIRHYNNNNNIDVEIGPHPLCGVEYNSFINVRDSWQH